MGKIASFITNSAIITGAIFLLFKSYLPNNDLDSDYTYFYYIVSQIRCELILMAIFLIYALNPSWFPFINFQSLEKKDWWALMTVAIISGTVLFIFRGDEIYGILRAKKNHYTQTIPNAYFNYLLSEANHFEEKGEFAEALMFYFKLQKHFFENSDSELIKDRIERIKMRKEISAIYYRNYEKKTIENSRDKIQNLLYAYILNPESEEIKKSVLNEYQNLNIIFKKVERLTDYPQNYCSLLKRIKDDELLQFIFDKRVYDLDFDKSNFTDCFPIYKPSLDDIKRSWFFYDIEDIVAKIE